MQAQPTFQEYSDVWLQDVLDGKPSTVELGHRFARKLITDYLGIDDSVDDVIYCDGSGDGGIDLACLRRGESGSDGTIEGDTWYLVQSKYGSAFSGVNTLISESQKIIDTLDGKRENLSSLSKELVGRLSEFRSKMSDKDKFVLLFATEQPMTDRERRALEDIRAMWKSRLGASIDLQPVSIQSVFDLVVEESVARDTFKIAITGDFSPSDGNLLIGAVKLLDLYNFLNTYQIRKGDIDQLYEKNVRKYLGPRRKVNQAIKETLEHKPEMFGLYNNGITIVVQDVIRDGNGVFQLLDPFIVNGCQTTKSIWEVLRRKLDSGGTGHNSDLDAWRIQMEKGVVVTKIVRVGARGDDQLRQITISTNSQNKISDKDFIALSADFQSWANQLASRHGIFLEIQRGAWDSQKALQRRGGAAQDFTESAEAGALVKVFGAGWLCEAGLARSKSSPFAPGGVVFEKIVSHDGEHEFGVEDLYASYLLQQAGEQIGFGRGAADSRRQTKYLFYMTAVELLRQIILDCGQGQASTAQITHALLEVLPRQQQHDLLIGTAVNAIDEYLADGTEDSVYKEPAFITQHARNLSTFLKWDQLGKNEASSPIYRRLVADHFRMLRRDPKYALLKEAISRKVQDTP